MVQVDHHENVDEKAKTRDEWDERDLKVGHVT